MWNEVICKLHVSVKSYLKMSLVKKGKSQVLKFEFKQIKMSSIPNLMPE